MYCYFDPRFLQVDPKRDLLMFMHVKGHTKRFVGMFTTTYHGGKGDS